MARCVPWVVYGTFSGFHIFTNPRQLRISAEEIESGTLDYRELKNVRRELVANLRLAMLVHGAGVVLVAGRSDIGRPRRRRFGPHGRSPGTLAAIAQRRRFALSGMSGASAILGTRRGAASTRPGLLGAADFPDHERTQPTRGSIDVHHRSHACRQAGNASAARKAQPRHGRVNAPAGRTLGAAAAVSSRESGQFSMLPAGWCCCPWPARSPQYGRADGVLGPSGFYLWAPILTGFVTGSLVAARTRTCPSRPDGFISP